MCWAIPAQITEVEGAVGKVELAGTVREVGLRLIDEPQVGDYVLVHAGFAIQKVDEQEALETLELFRQMLSQAGEADEIR